MWRDWLQGISSLIWVPSCLGCEKPVEESTHPLCPSCQQNLPRLIPPQGVRSDNRGGFIQAVSLFPYEGVIQKLVGGLKYDRRESWVPFLGKCLVQAIGLHFPEEKFDLLVPIPLHPTRFRERGFNQAELLAQVVSRQLSIPHRNLLKRIRSTPAQTTLSRSERIQNMKQAFALRGKPALHGLRLLLMDDVLTTGATAHSCAQTLRKAGAARVDVVTLAHG